MEFIGFVISYEDDFIKTVRLEAEDKRDAGAQILSKIAHEFFLAEESYEAEDYESDIVDVENAETLEELQDYCALWFSTEFKVVEEDSINDLKDTTFYGAVH